MVCSIPRVKSSSGRNVFENDIISLASKMFFSPFTHRLAHSHALLGNSPQVHREAQTCGWEMDYAVAILSGFFNSVLVLGAPGDKHHDVDLLDTVGTPSFAGERCSFGISSRFLP